MRPAILIALFLTAGIKSTSASHVMGGSLELAFIENDQYEVILYMWRDCGGINPSISEDIDYSSPCGSGTITLGVDDPQGELVSPYCLWDQGASTTCNGGTIPGVELYVYKGTLTLVPCDSWTLTWNSGTLTGSIANYSGGNGFRVQATLNNASMQCLSTIRFAQRELLYATSADGFDHELNPYFDGPRSPYFELVEGEDTNGDPWVFPPPYSGAMPYPGLTIDPVTARLSTDSTAILGAFIMNVLGTVTDSTGALLTSTQRVFVVINLGWPNHAPDVGDGTIQMTSGQGIQTGDRSLELWPGESFCFTAEYTDQDQGDSLLLESDLVNVLPGGTFSYSVGNPAIANYCWTAPMSANGKYRFITKVKDNVCPIEGRQQILYTVTVLPDTLNPCTPVGIFDDDLPDRGLSIRPNPTTGVFRIDDADLQQNQRLELIGLDGKNLGLIERNGTEFQISSSIPNGTYLIRSSEYWAKIILQR